MTRNKKILLLSCCSLIFFNHPGVCQSQTHQVVPEKMKKTRQFVPRKIKKKGSEYYYQHALKILSSEANNPDYGEAVKLLQQAAKQGHVIAQYSLALRYLLGQGVTQDYSEAVKWLAKSAKQGLSDAQYSLAMRYMLGQGVKKDINMADKWLRLAAQQGNAEALFQLVYQQALQGNVAAQYYLAVMYNNGNDKVQKDSQKAAEWYRKAAEQGHVEAQLNLGALYATGNGVPQDFIIAYAWTHLAAVSGNEIAQKNCKQARDEMTPDQIKKAIELTSGLIDSK